MIFQEHADHAVGAIMFFRQCTYTPVKSPLTDTEFTEDMLYLTVTKEMQKQVRESGE